MLLKPKSHGVSIYVPVYQADDMDASPPMHSVKDIS